MSSSLGIFTLSLLRTTPSSYASYPSSSFSNVALSALTPSLPSIEYLDDRLSLYRL